MCLPLGILSCIKTYHDTHSPIKFAVIVLVVNKFSLLLCCIAFLWAETLFSRSWCLCPNALHIVLEIIRMNAKRKETMEKKDLLANTELPCLSISQFSYFWPCPWSYKMFTSYSNGVPSVLQSAPPPRTSDSASMRQSGLNGIVLESSIVISWTINTKPLWPRRGAGFKYNQDIEPIFMESAMQLVT